MVLRIVEYFEKQAYGVCAWWGDRLGMRPHKIRISFIYLSFITFGSPVLIYLIMAFILEHKENFKLSKRRVSIWDLE